MRTRPDWTEHRRGGDGELLGWLVPTGEGVVAVDLLGRPRTGAVDPVTAEQALEAAGIGYLADAYELLVDGGRWQRVRIVEVSRDVVRVKEEDWGAIDGPHVEYTLDLPVSDRLRPA